MGDLDDQDGRDGLECKLGNRSYGPNQRILVSMQASIFLEAEDGSISKNGFVKDLEEVDPNQNNQDHFVSLSTDSLVLRRALLVSFSQVNLGIVLA